MKRKVQLLLAAGIFFCGYLPGHMGTPISRVKNAEAVQGPLPISCGNIQVSSVSCKKDNFVKYATVVISGAKWEDYPSPRIDGYSDKKYIELAYE